MNVKIYMNKLDEIANLWNKTKDPNHKANWYKKMRELSVMLASSQVKRKPGNQTSNKSRVC